MLGHTRARVGLGSTCPHTGSPPFAMFPGVYLLLTARPRSNRPGGRLLAVLMENDEKR